MFCRITNGIKTANTTLSVLFIAAYFDPTKSPSGEILIKKTEVAIKLFFFSKLRYKFLRFGLFCSISVVFPLFLVYFQLETYKESCNLRNYKFDTFKTLLVKENITALHLSIFILVFLYL